MQNEFSQSERKAREFEAEIRRRLTGRATKVAEALGWSDSKMSRWKDCDLPEVVRILAELGVELAGPADGVTISREDYRVLRLLADRGTNGFLDSLPSV